MEREGVEKILWQLGIAFIVIGSLIGVIIGFALKINFGVQELMLDADPPSIAHPYRWAYAGIIIACSAFFGAVLIGLSEIILKMREQTHAVELKMDSVRRLLDEK